MSTKAKHTPGPWHVEEGGESGEYWFSVVSKVPHERDEERIAETWIPANARLIAAAPDLLAACKMALARFDEEVIHGRRPSVHPLEYAAIIRAAIAKAEGNEP